MEPQVLVLNVWMQPHAIYTWQDAIVALYKGNVDVLEEYEATVSSPSVTLQIPAVIKLRKTLSTHKKGLKFSRMNVLTRDGQRCCYCGQRGSLRDLNYDHVLPRSRGGTTTWLNIVTAHRGCNTRKGNKTPAEAGLKMHFQPHVPRSLPMARPFLIDLEKAPPQWLPYLTQSAETA
jgi:5-methylcytosine-specific restriction endonuclease McrA